MPMLRHSRPHCGFPLAVIVLLAIGTTPSPVAAQSIARDTSVRLAGNAVVDITLRTGRIVVRGVDGTTGAIRGGGRDYQLRTSGVGIVVNGRDEDRSGPLELDVPPGARLVINTTSADVDVREMRGDVEVRTNSGDVRGDRVTGRVIVETISGDIDVAGAMTLLRITTVSGDVMARGMRGELEVRTTSGELRLDGERITRLEAESMSGDLWFEGGLSDDARVRMTTHSGDVTFRLPTSAKGRLDLSTVTGELDAGGPLTLMPGELPANRRGRNARRYEFNGGGLMQLEISTFSGDVRMLRGIRS